jgi:hypothetical protein
MPSPSMAAWGAPAAVARLADFPQGLNELFSNPSVWIQGAIPVEIYGSCHQARFGS